MSKRTWGEIDEKGGITKGHQEEDKGSHWIGRKKNRVRKIGKQGKEEGRKKRK